ncbi:MAG TPA: outer membrane beta-barrel protein [Sideroxyarcus sp.]|nr:outer membrane beta-barrel protein [Sideroxyarcus sp.]
MKNIILVIMLTITSLQAVAADLYLLGGAGLVKTPSIQNATPSEDPGNTQSLTAGWKIKNTVALELGYDRIGEINYKTPVLNVATGAYINKQFQRNVGRSVEIAALGIYPFTDDGFSWVGKIGMANTSFTYSNPDNLANVPSNYSKTSALAGVGVQFEGADGTTLRLIGSRKSGGPMTSIIGHIGVTF